MKDTDWHVIIVPAIGPTDSMKDIHRSITRRSAFIAYEVVTASLFAELIFRKTIGRRTESWQHACETTETTKNSSKMRQNKV